MPGPSQAPFPWFGGKSRAAGLVWERLGDPVNYVEPFAGSLAVLLARPHEPRNETVNDKDAYLANFWRALQADPEGVARWADYPVSEVDLHARHAWLVHEGRPMVDRCFDDPDYYNEKVAGWWVWGICQWIGGEWCYPRERPERQRPAMARGGRGVLSSKIPYVDQGGRGVHRAGVTDLAALLCDLAGRLRRVRICAGDFRRVLTPAVTTQIGVTGVPLDPPYSKATGRKMGIYTVDSENVAAAAREWALAHGDDPAFRIALCGYEDEHDMPAAWTAVKWEAAGGYGNQSKGKNLNRYRETTWFSPHCLKPEVELPLFAATSEA
jgi:hypothetical protein